VPAGTRSQSQSPLGADPCAKKVWLFDPQSGEVVDQIAGLGTPIDVSIHSGLIWIVSFRDNLVTVLSEKTLNIVAQGHAGEGAIAITAHGREAWVANHEDYSLTHLTLQ
jgi:hypothetical protein